MNSARDTERPFREFKEALILKFLRSISFRMSIETISVFKGTVLRARLSRQSKRPLRHAVSEESKFLFSFPFCFARYAL